MDCCLLKLSIFKEGAGGNKSPPGYAHLASGSVDSSTPKQAKCEPLFPRLQLGKVQSFHQPTNDLQASLTLSSFGYLRPKRKPLLTVHM